MSGKSSNNTVETHWIKNTGKVSLKTPQPPPSPLMR